MVTYSPLAKEVLKSIATFLSRVASAGDLRVEPLNAATNEQWLKSAPFFSMSRIC